MIKHKTLLFTWTLFFWGMKRVLRQHLPHPPCNCICILKPWDGGARAWKRGVCGLALTVLYTRVTYCPVPSVLSADGQLGVFFLVYWAPLGSGTAQISVGLIKVLEPTVGSLTPRDCMFTVTCLSLQNQRFLPKLWLWKKKERAPSSEVPWHKILSRNSEPPGKDFLKGTLGINSTRTLW